MLEVVYLSPNELTPYENNTRKHSPKDIEQIKESILKDGFNDPIGIWGEQNLIVEGHGRKIAAEELHIEKVPCIRLDHLTETQRKDYAIRHNRVAEFSEWDEVKKDLEIAALQIEGIDLTSLFADDKKKKKEKDQRGDVEFSEVLGEENNYLILQFKTSVDWLYACSVFGIGQAQSFSTRKDGVITENMHRIGTARVLDGVKAIRKIVGDDG